MVYSIFLPALYIGVFLLLAGLIFRGIAFEFRFKANKSRFLWNWSFAGGSTIASLAQGAVVGAYIQGFETANGVYVGSALDWLTPFTVLTALGLLAGYALLGSTWLIMKTEGHLQEWAYRLTGPLLMAVLAVFAIISVWTPFVDDMVRDRWFSNLTVIWLLPVLSMAFAFLIFRSVRQRSEALPFVATMGLFISTYLGLVVSRWPYVVPPDYTLWDAASSPDSQLFLLIGLIFVIPVVLGYTAWTYWVFRGKVRAGEGYH
jgi:cytochrome d ubiquinol oxidase subunit II